MKIIGLKKTTEIIVDNSMTASIVGSGYINVLATPIIIIHLEKLCASMLEEIINNQIYSSVGVEISLKHIAPTPIGLKVFFNSEIIFIKKKIVKFELKVYDEKEMISYGIHIRIIINKNKFLINLNNKKSTI